MVLVVIAIYCLLTVMTIRNPLIGAGSLWIVMWTYPNNLLSGTFPLNIRFDDLYIVITFLSSILNPRQKLEKSATLLISVIWLVVILLGNINGYFFIGGQFLDRIIKLVLKATYVPMITTIILLNLNDFKSLQFILKGMLLAGAAVAILGICTVLFPEQFQLFLGPDLYAVETVLDRLEHSELIERRARGSVGTVATSLICPIICLLGIITLSIKNNKIFPQFLLMTICTICFLGLLYTQSRGPLLGFCIVTVFFLSTLKKGTGLIALAFFAGAVAIFLMVDSPLREMVLNRFTGGSGEEFDQGVGLRAHIWDTFISKFEPINLVNGLGMVPVKTVYTYTVHNTYLGSIIYGGIWGVAVMTMAIFRPLRLTQILRSKESRYAQQWAIFLPLILVFFLVTGFSIENFQQTNSMQIYLAILALAERIPLMRDLPNAM